MESAAAIDRLMSSAIPPPPAMPATTPPRSRMRLRRPEARSPKVDSPREALSEARSIFLIERSPLVPTETRSALTRLPPSTARRTA